MLVKNYKSIADTKQKKDLLQIIDYAILRSTPNYVLKNVLKKTEDNIFVNGKEVADLKKNRIFVIGAGKASGIMAENFEKIIGIKNITAGRINYKGYEPKTKKINAKTIKDAIVKEIVGLNRGRAGDAWHRPNLAVFMIGEDKQADKFVDSLEKEAVKVGIDTHTYKCSGNSDEEELRAMIECLNDDELIDGIYLHLPLPDNFNEEDPLALIKTDKD